MPKTKKIRFYIPHKGNRGEWLGVLVAITRTKNKALKQRAVEHTAGLHLEKIILRTQGSLLLKFEHNPTNRTVLPQRRKEDQGIEREMPVSRNMKLFWELLCSEWEARPWARPRLEMKRPLS